MKSVKRPFILKILILLSLALLCAAACFINSFSSSDSARASVDDNYHFKSVDFTASVNKDKSLTVCETLEVEFDRSGVNTGIIRDIQRLSKSTRVIDGKFVEGKVYIATLSDVSVTFDGGNCKVTQSLYDENQFYSIKMQQPEGYITKGTHTFVLNYTYGMADDRVKGYDDLTYDVLGYAMARTEKFTATVTFPGDADLSNVTFRTNGKREWLPDASRGESAEVVGKVIKFTAYPEMAGEGFTVQVLMQEGYFGGIRFVWYYAIFALIALAGTGAVIALFLKCRNVKALETVEFYPPDGMSVMRFAAVWRIKSKFKDAGALILKWAGMGIVSVQNDGRHDVTVRANVLKGKGYSGKKASPRLPKSDVKYFDTVEEESYFNTLFSGIGGANFTFSTRYFKSYASYSKQKLLYEAVTETATDAFSKPYPVKQSTTKGKLAMPFIALIPTVSMIIYNCILTYTTMPLFMLIFVIAGCVPLALFNYELDSGSFTGILYVILIFPITFYGMPYGVFIGEYYFGNYDYAYLTYFAPAVWFVGGFILPRFMIKRTKEAQADYGRIRGFRNFILKAELPKIQVLFDENPFYFSDILPYCLIMGISEKVKKRFGALQIKIPEYIEQGVNVHSLCDSVGHSCAMGAPRTSFSSGGGGGGGGSSGGGGGSGGSSGGGGGGGGSRGC